jgi:hypothetical protein
LPIEQTLLCKPCPHHHWFPKWIFAIICLYLLFTILQTSFGEMQLARIPKTQSLKDFEKCKSSMDFNVVIE